MGAGMSILREAAKGQQCTIRLPGCRFDPDYTVLAHENGAGMAIKHHDLRSAFACDKCHAQIDSETLLSQDQKELAFYRGHMETLQWFIDNGYVQIVNPVLPTISTFDQGLDLYDIYQRGEHL